MTARHRLPLVPILILFASVGILYLYTELKNYRSKKYIVSIVILAVTLILFNQRYYNEKEIGGDSGKFQIYFNEGIQFEKLGELQKALEAYKKADQVFPNSATLVNNLAFLQYKLALYQDAERNFKRSISFDKDFAASYNNFGLLKQTTGNLDSALQLFNKALTLFKNSSDENSSNISMAYANLADLFDQKQDSISADKMYEKSLGQNVVYFQALPRAASFYARLKMFTKSDSLFNIALKENTLKPSHLFNWGLSYMRRNQIENGLVRLKECVQKDSLFYQAYHLIGYGLYKTHAPKDSVLYYLNKALLINPNFKQSLSLKNEVLKK